MEFTREVDQIHQDTGAGDEPTIRHLNIPQVTQPGVVEVHDLHVWEVTSGFPALSAHVTVRAGDDCHERRRALQLLLMERFQIEHTTLQVDHEGAVQAPLQIEVARLDSQP